MTDTSKELTKDEIRAPLRPYNERDRMQVAMATGEWETTGKRPVDGCKACHGRGHVGYNLVMKRYVPCKCVKKA